MRSRPSTGPGTTPLAQPNPASRKWEATGGGVVIGDGSVRITAPRRTDGLASALVGGDVPKLKDMSYRQGMFRHDGYRLVLVGALEQVEP